MYKHYKYCRILVKIILFCLFPSMQLLAYEMPTVTIIDAINKSKSAFIGRVQKINEIRREQYYVDSELSLEVVKCYYGINCNKKKQLRIKYKSQSYADGEFPVYFLISEEYLFLMSEATGDQDENTLFDSNLKGGIDIAYLLLVNTAETGFDVSPYLTTKESTIGIKSVYEICEKTKYIKKSDIDRYLYNKTKEIEKQK